MLRFKLPGSRLACLFLIWIVFLSLFFLTCWETPESLTRKRIKSVEKGLLKAVVLRGQKLEKMKLSKRMKYYRVSAVSLAVMDEYQIDWAKGYGVQDRKGMTKVTSESLFQAGSLSQPVAALGALHFVSTGRMGLDENVNHILQAWKVPENQFTREKKVTLRGLLSHSAGLNAFKFKGYSQEEAIPSLLQVLGGQKPTNSRPVRVVSVPGTRMRYSEGGYAVLQQLMVDLEGKPFPQIMEETVLEPLNMNHSSFAWPLPVGLRERMVPGHHRDGQKVEGGWFLYPEKAAAGLWSTPSDLARFAIAIMDTAMGRSQRIISPKLARAMLTVQLGNKGLGFSIGDEGDNLNFNQRGSNQGFECYLIAYPVRGKGAVIMTNSENGAYLIDEICRAISEAYDWPHFQPEVKSLYRLDPSVYAQYVGKYEVNSDYTLTVTHQDYYLIIQPTGQAPTKFYVENQTTFFSTDPYIQIQFVKNAQGEVSGLVLRQRDTGLEAKKIE
ncbi:MAG: serine hydrolase domain-containing protein [Candidatus Aminicenantes bacterium]